MDPASLILTVGGLLAAFKGAVDTILLIESFVDDEQSKCSDVALDLHIQNTRLQFWGEQCKLDDPSGSILAEKPRYIQGTIMMILKEMQSLHDKAQSLTAKHGVKLVGSPSINKGLESWETIQKTTFAQPKGIIKPTHKISWVIKNKERFKEIVNRISELMDCLEGFSYSSSDADVASKALTSRTLVQLQDASLLETLAKQNGTDASLELVSAAKAKLLQQRSSFMESQTPKMIARDGIKFIGGDSSCGQLLIASENKPFIWIEWNEFHRNSDSKNFDRIKSLAYLLENVGVTALRLPSCYGLYEDMNHIQNSPTRRIGYVFGLPSVPATHDGVPYEKNILHAKPENLLSLLADRKELPSLGERFALAYTLASAFSLFHAAGWLHKGLNSKNIMFFHRVDDRGITIREPFITGFQYSRLQDQASLSYSPLENKKLEYYYHPESEKGFSKQRDLYGLGVILFEICHWEPFSDRVKNKKRAPTNCQEWQEYLIRRCDRELGWLMGENYQKAVRALLGSGRSALPGDTEGGADSEIFAQSFYERVLYPLSQCRA